MVEVRVRNFAPAAKREGALGAYPSFPARLRRPFPPVRQTHGRSARHPRTTTSSSLEQRHGPKLGGGEFSCMLVCLLCVRHVGELDAASRPSRRSRRRFHWIGHAVGWNFLGKRSIGAAQGGCDQYSGFQGRKQPMLNLIFVSHVSFLRRQRLLRSANARTCDPLGPCAPAMSIYL
jgi:hypothetical protein